MKNFVVAVFRKDDLGGYSSSMYTINSPSIDSAIRNFWAIDGNNNYEDEDYEGHVTIYNPELKKVVYRFGCGE